MYIKPMGTNEKLQQNIGNNKNNNNNNLIITVNNTFR